MKETEPQVIAEATYRSSDGRDHLQILKVGGHYELVSESGGERLVHRFKDKHELERLLSGSAMFENNHVQAAVDGLLSDFIRVTEFQPDPVDMLLQESTLKNPLL